MNLTFTVPIPDELVPILQEKARGAGLECNAYVGAILARELTAMPRLAQVLGEFRDQVSASAVTDAELDALFNSARDESHSHESA